METPMPTSGDPIQSMPREFYLRAMAVLDDACVPYLVGGGYALGAHAGIQRQTKDLDLFVLRGDYARTMDTLAAAGYQTEQTFHFLGKALHNSAFVDILFNSGNGLCPVDEEWFVHAVEGQVLGRAVRLCPVEEMIWSKSFVQERDRFDGADVAHLLLACGQRLDWPRLLRRFRGHERVLLAHLILFGYIYPSEWDRIPPWVMDELATHVRRELPGAIRVCRGTVFSHNQYTTDIQTWGFADARLTPLGTLTAKDIETFG